MAHDDVDVRTAAARPGQPTMVDLVVLAALRGRDDPDLRELARWIELAHRVDRPTRHVRRVAPA
ncbi:MAG TPA: hypothetical protein VH373_11835 [Jatrophihabitantaceae bacterium]|jgi:hypothetical protein